VIINIIHFGETGNFPTDSEVEDASDDENNLINSWEVELERLQGWTNSWACWMLLYEFFKEKSIGFFGARRYSQKAQNWYTQRNKTR